MPEPVTTIVVALIGAVAVLLAAVLTVLLTDKYTQKKERQQRQNIIIQRYLYQLQDALATLWYRLGNLAFRDGRSVMTDDYYISTTLYAIGKVLAIGHIFDLEAVYPQLDAAYPELGKCLSEYSFDLNLQKFNVYQYERNLLAEAVIVHEGDLFRTITYFEFRKRYKEEEFSELLKTAINAINSLDIKNKNDIMWMEEQMNALFKPAEQITKYASVVGTIPNSEKLTNKSLRDLYLDTVKRP